MDPIRELLARLAELTAAELEEGIALVRARAAEISDDATAEAADELTALADALDAFTGRQAELHEEEEAARARAAAARARINPDPADDSDDDSDDDGDDSDDDDDADSDADADADADHRDPVTAGGGRRGLPTPGHMSRRQGGGRSTPRPVEPLRARATIVAAADLGGGIASGAQFTSIDSLAEAFDRRRRSVMSTSGGVVGEKVTVATVQEEWPEERTLTDDADVNRQRIAAAAAPRTMVAAAEGARARGAVVAAGLCAPVQTVYDVEVLGSTARPVRDALLGFQTSRGGITYRQPPVFQDSTAAVGTWTLADDASLTDPGVADAGPKPCLDVWCPDMDTAYIEATTLCLTFSNITARFDPESTAANIRAGQIAQARFAENKLLKNIATQSKTLTQPAAVSAARDILVMLDKAMAYQRNRHRLEDSVPLRTILPRWARDLMRADLTRGFNSSEAVEALSIADADILAWFARRNANPTWHLDGNAATVAGASEVAMPNQFYADAADNGVLPGFPDAIECLVFTEGDWMFLNGGSLDLGVVRDSTLNARNQYKTFAETFEGLAKRGVEPLRIVAGAQPTGAIVGTLAPALVD